MKLSRLIKNLYQQIFIGIVVQQSSIRLFVQTFKGKKADKEISETFDVSGSTPTDDIYSFIKKFTDESPFTYICVLNDGVNQGALPTCSIHEAEQFSDLSSSVTLCNNNNWMIYTQKDELDDLQKRFELIGIDFIFSPFSVLSRFFKEKTETKATLLVLVQKDYLSVCIFKEKNLLFAQHYTTIEIIEDEVMSDHLEETPQESLDFELEDEENLSINLDDIDTEEEMNELDDLDDLQELDDLDDLGEIEDFEESLNDAIIKSEEELKETKTDSDNKIDNFSDDYKHFQLIQASLNQFYHDEKYDSQFIEDTYIADASDVGQDLVRFLEEELFMNVYKRTINLEKELVYMSLEELEDEI